MYIALQDHNSKV